MPVACRAAAAGGPEPGTPGKPGPGRTAASDAPGTVPPSSPPSSSSSDPPIVSSADPDQSAVGCLFDRLPLGAFLARLLGPLVAKLLRTWLWSRRVHAPIRVTLGDAPGNDALLAACPRFDAAASSYDAVEALANRHASTIVASVFRADAKVEYQREVLRMRDGGHVTLDWPIRVPNEGGEETRGFPVKPATSEGGSFRTGSGDEGESASSSSSSSASPSSASSASKARLAAQIAQLQYGAAGVPPSNRLRTDSNADPSAANPGGGSSSSSASPRVDDGVPGVIGVAGGGGADGCGSGGVGCADPFEVGSNGGGAPNVDAAAQNHLPVGPPYRRSIPDQGVHATRAFLSTHWRVLPDDAPVLVLMSGIAGGSHDKYLKHFLVGAARRGYRCVAFNCRGTSDSPLTTPQFYSASFTGDARAVVDELKGRWPDADVFCVGWSLGANILTNFLGEEGKDAKVAGAVAMCNPFDLNKCDEALQRGFFGTLYSRSMAANMRKLFAPHAHLFAGLPGYDRALVERAKTVRDFDEAVTRVTFGFPSVDAYYDASSSAGMIERVRVPLLVVQAEDDPIAVRDATPREAIGAMREGNVILVETPSGGHLGWTAGEEAPFGAPWPDRGAFEFLDAVRARKHREASEAGEAGAGDEAEVKRAKESVAAESVAASR